MTGTGDTPSADRGGFAWVRDAAVLVAIVGLAAVLRFDGLAGRGTWDADQGHDMVVLRELVTQGQVPLLGPPTSIGTFHHGALYYYLLAPAAWLSGSDPTGVTAAIAIAGLLTVIATWWLGRQIGGPRAGHIAGLLTAISPAAIEQSTFIWNPNLIPAASAIAVASAWRAWRGGSAWWWTLAAVGAGVVMQCHVLGVVLLPAIAALWIADIRRTARSERGNVMRAGFIGGALILLMYVPLLVYEATHGFAETRAIVAWIASGGGSGPPFPQRLPIVAWRVIAWPLAGLIADRPIASLIAVVLVIGMLVFRSLTGSGQERTAIRWLAGTVVWAILALTVAAPSLATIVPGLPNDHYHAFADPVVLVIVALGIGGLAGALGRPPSTRRERAAVSLAPAAAVVSMLAVVAIEASALPPMVAWDGGWPGAQSAAAHIRSVTGTRSIELVSLPSLKSADAIGFPLSLDPPATTSGHALVVICDPRLEALIGSPCGGPAEQRTQQARNAGMKLADRWQASPQRTISIYLP